MELPPDIKQHQKEFDEFIRIAALSNRLQKDFERILIKDNDYNYMKDGCYNAKSCGCHCSCMCDNCAREHYVAFFRSLPLPKVHGNQANPLQSFAFTLTLPTDSQPVRPLLEVAKSIMESGLTNKPYERAIEYAYVLEHTEAGTPHIHGMYKTNSGRRIASKYFQRYHSIKGWKKTPEDPYFWNENKHLGHGHRGGYHQKARHDQSYAAYMKKEGEIIFSPPIINED